MAPVFARWRWARAGVDGAARHGAAGVERRRELGRPRGRQFVVDRVPRQRARLGLRHLGRDVLTAQPRLDVAGPRRPVVRRAARDGRARLRGDGERHDLRAGRGQRLDPVVEPRGDAGALERPSLWGHWPADGHYGHARRRPGARRDLRRGRRARERERSRPLPRWPEHLLGRPTAQSGRRPAGPADDGHPAAHRVEPERRQRGVRLRRQRRRLLDLQRLGRRRARGWRTTQLLPGGADR